jgi:fluoroquinolone resistance protein
VGDHPGLPGRFDGARFGGADLRCCDLEDMVMTDPDFHDADLRGALLTGSQMLEASFLGANLRDTGLAEIDWPGADLRDVDLQGASFHLGSSRNGLVGSPIACEGSRTGFYTDDYHDQNIKPAEEIRKANLRGADLRGATIDGVDFYLVDLRDATYTLDQGAHLRHCRAILDDRVG